MTYPPYIREKARWMRSERDMTLDEISERLSIGKPTIWAWISDIDSVLIGNARRSPARSAAQKRAGQANADRAEALRAAAYARGFEQYDALVKRPGFRDFVCMYIGEGYKRNRNRVAICNSDPCVMKLASFWLNEVTETRLDYSLQYHADQDPDVLRHFWASELGIEPEDIRLQRKSNSNQLKGRMWRSRWGVVTIGANDTYLRSRLQAWIDEVTKSWLDCTSYGV